MNNSEIRIIRVNYKFKKRQKMKEIQQKQYLYKIQSDPIR